MKILIYGLNYAPERTGIGKYTGDMAAWFAARGHEVEAIVGLPHYPQWALDDGYEVDAPRIEHREGVRVMRAPHYFPPAHQVTARTRIRMETSFSWSSARYWIPKLFQRQVPDVVIAVMPPLQIGVWPLLYRKLRGVPCVLHVQDLQVDAAFRLGILKAKGWGRWLYRIESLLMRHSSLVTSITEPMRRRVVAKGVADNQTGLFPNWADTREVTPGERDNGFRKALGYGPEHVLVLYSGNMGQKQGLGLVLEAAERLKAQTAIQFLMVGDGSARDRLAARAQAMQLDNLKFLPLQPPEQLPAMLAAGDIHLVVQQRAAADLVMPSKLTNILAAGRPCVATTDAETALGAAVQGHELGLVIPPEDPALLVQAIQTLADDPALRSRCGQAARAYAERYLDRDAVLTRFERRLRGLCGTRELVSG